MGAGGWEGEPVGNVVHHIGNHQGLGNELIEPIAANTNGGEGVVRRRVRLGGVLSYYYRDAA